MGGSVHVYLRTPQGDFYRMRRWTNSLGLIENCILRPNTEEEVNNYMQSWLDMHEDWKMNKHKQRFHFPMTDAYFPSPTDINYSEYGAVFVDFVSKTLLSFNDYTALFNWQYPKFHMESKWPEEERDHWNNVKHAREHADIYTLNWKTGEFAPCNDILEFLRTWNFDSPYDLWIKPRGWNMEQGMKHDMKSREFKRTVKEILETT